MKTILILIPHYTQEGLLAPITIADVFTTVFRLGFFGLHWPSVIPGPLGLLIISPGSYFWSKDLFAKFFLGNGGGGGYVLGAYTRTNICILKTLFFVQATVMF